LEGGAKGRLVCSARKMERQVSMPCPFSHFTEECSGLIVGPMKVFNHDEQTSLARHRIKNIVQSSPDGRCKSCGI
jgi:hypothetical protein